MINNSTNINKTKNLLSPQVIKTKKITTYDVGNPGADFGQAHKRGRVKPVNVIPTLILLIIGRTKLFYFYL
jgi:hypothetical protein